METTEKSIDRKTSGWGAPLASKKFHWFDNSAISLCGKWMFTGYLDGDADSKNKDDCAVCRKKLEKAKTKK